MLVASSTAIKDWEQLPPAAFILLANSWISIGPFSIKKINNSTVTVTTTRKEKKTSAITITTITIMAKIWILIQPF